LLTRPFSSELRVLPVSWICTSVSSIATSARSALTMPPNVDGGAGLLRPDSDGRFEPADKELDEEELDEEERRRSFSSSLPLVQ
jgi:hypothetical protein